MRNYAQPRVAVRNSTRNDNDMKTKPQPLEADRWPADKTAEWAADLATDTETARESILVAYNDIRDIIEDYHETAQRALGPSAGLALQADMQAALDDADTAFSRIDAIQETADTTLKQWRSSRNTRNAHAATL